MRRTSSRVSLLLTIAIAGCAGGGSAVVANLSTDAGAYSAGDDVEIALRNDSDQDLGYNICYAFLLLQREMGGEWQETQVGLGPEPDAPCTTQLNLLEPAASTQGTAYLPDDLPPGTYRISTMLEVEGVRTELHTEPFAVES